MGTWRSGRQLQREAEETGRMTTRIYVNRKAIEANAHAGAAGSPCVTVDRGGVREDCYGVEILGPSRVVYSVRRTHDGAHVWMETDADVRPIGVHEQ